MLGCVSFPAPLWGEQTKGDCNLNRRFHRPNHNSTIQGTLFHFCMDCEFPPALVPWLFLPNISLHYSHGGNKPEPDDGWAHDSVSVEFWCGYWLCVFSHNLEGLCKNGQYLIWHEICLVKINPTKLPFCIWTIRVNFYWVPNVPWLWHFWVYFLLLRGEFTILLKVCRLEKVGLGACRARNTENISLIAGENLFLELVIRELHENHAVRKDMERGMSRLKKAALLLMNENRMWLCLILQTYPRVTPLRDMKNTALNTLFHCFIRSGVM